MEKSKSFSGYSTAYRELYDAGSGFEDRSKSYSFNGPSNKGGQDTPGNPELKRRRRVALYNMYTVEDKLKSSLRSSFKWIKSKFINDLYE